MQAQAGAEQMTWIDMGAVFSQVLCVMAELCVADHYK